MHGDKNDKPAESDQGSEELAAEELEKVSGGAAYLKFEGVDGESRRKVSKVDALTIKQK